MGKYRKQRTSYHISPLKSTGSKVMADKMMNTSLDSPLEFQVPENLFANINMKLDLLKKNYNDDTLSFKSFKSVKSSKNAEKTMNKKEKLKLRRELLMAKIDFLNQKKKQEKMRKKRQTTAKTADPNPLQEDLPSLESLTNSNQRNPPKQHKPKKCTLKASRRKKEAIKNIKLYKKICKNEKFNTNPLRAIAEHVNAFVADVTDKNKKSN